MIHLPAGEPIAQEPPQRALGAGLAEGHRQFVGFGRRRITVPSAVLRVSSLRAFMTVTPVFPAGAWRRPTGIVASLAAEVDLARDGEMACSGAGCQE
jgi:hypothetical protein